MAIGIIGSDNGSHSGGSDPGAMAWTYAHPSGARRSSVAILSRGYGDSLTGVFPAAIIAGGQGIARSFQAFGGNTENYELAAYRLTEAQIASMFSTTFTASFVEEIPAPMDVRWAVVTLGDTNQTLVDSDEVDGYLGSSPMSVNVTTSSGNYVLVMGGCRGDVSLTTASGWTNIAGASNATDSASEDTKIHADYFVATGSSTDAVMEFTGAELNAMVAFVFAEDTGGGGGSSVSQTGTESAEHLKAEGIALTEYAEHTATNTTATTSDLAAPRRWSIVGV